MSASVEVVVDTDDDIADVRAIHRRAARSAAILAVTIEPGNGAAETAIWGILRGLGKRAYRIERRAKWEDIDPWIAAHGIREVIVLRATLLSSDGRRGLIAFAGRHRLRLILIEANREHGDATTTFASVIERGLPRASPTIEEVGNWPQVPRSSALLLRHDLDWRLGEPERRDAKDLLAQAQHSFADWLRRHKHLSAARLRLAAAVVAAGHDPEQRYIRRCAAHAAMLTAGIPIPTGGTGIRRKLQQASVSAALAQTDPRHALRELAGLPDDMYALIGPDQITSTKLLGQHLSVEAWPVLRAAAPTARREAPRLETASRPPAENPAMPTDPGAAEALGRLLRADDTRLSRNSVQRPARRQLDALVGTDILARHGDYYAATHYAIYGARHGNGPLAPRPGLLQIH